MERMLLVLKPTAEQQQTLGTLIEKLHDPASPVFHQWLTPTEFGQRFGASSADIEAIVQWLQFHGFRVDNVANSKLAIAFSGTASQVETAFHTAIWRISVNGEEHWANINDPSIPQAIAPVVAGISTLHDFRAKSHLVSRNQTAAYQPQPGANLSGGQHGLSPGDYAIIYNIKPLYQTGINGSGVTIAVVGRSNFNVQDVIDFRSLFGLAANPPQIVLNGPDPGDLGGGEELEAVLDASWSGATAPAATIKFVLSQSTNTTDGVDLSSQYIIDHNLAAVMTESFGSCEANYTQAQATMINASAQQAVAQGITYLVSTGDSGSAGCDDPGSETVATGPLSVNMLAASPYVLAVGGTEFNDVNASSTYWAGQNGTGIVSALSYIPENVWNESCAASATCTNPGIWAAGGGASGFFSKPSWQTGVAGIPADGSRDIPDVSMTAAAGRDPYLVCIGGSCHGGRQVGLVGGTSAATPSMAGVIALVNQKLQGRQGQANYVLYRLAAQQQVSQCNGSFTGGLPASSCIFNDVTSGNNDVPGETGFGTAHPSYNSGAGYDLATGLGSVNATNLVNSWASAAGPVVVHNPSVISLTPVTGAGSNQSYTIQVADTAGASDLTVVNLLINTALDGRQACYIAYVPQSNTVYLVGDAGNPGGPFTTVQVGGSGSAANSQCAVYGAGSTVATSGNAMTLVLNIGFSSAFNGNKVLYLAAGDSVQKSTGWQTMGVVAVPPIATTYPAPVSMTPPAGTATNAILTFTYQDALSAAYLQTAWALFNTALDGRNACYVAYYRPGNQLFLVPDNGDGTLAVSMVLTGTNSVSNSQCSISAVGSSATINGAQLILKLNFTFNATFAGQKDVWMAVQTLSGAQVSAWQALATWLVP